MNDEVNKFLDVLNHPLRNEIDELRMILLNSNNILTENIKWNGPNYCFENQDRITMRILPPKQIQLIFHREAKKCIQPEFKLIDDNSGLLFWKQNDRAIATFKNLDEIKNAKLMLEKIIDSWINATK